MKTLVAEDDPSIRLLHVTALKQRGHHVLEADDGDVAWKLFEKEHPSLLILDWQMPRLDGLSLTRRIREAEAERAAFILMVTARDQEDDLLTSLDAGADDYLSKPFTPDALQARLNIAERRIAVDREHRKTEAALREARYLAGIGETAVALQHEINNPLAAVVGNVQLLERGMVPANEMQSVMHDIVTQSKRITDVLGRLRELTQARSVDYAEGIKMLDLTKHQE
ncbi:MAG TPA: response regulator [Gemmatimonadaceae bacterium]|nr:response regulator [Gemmatimonadaceae bacterium]